MNASNDILQAVDSLPVKRKPRIMIAGEFSAGKSRLINSLVGKDILPSNVTSTALPPMWLVGDGQESLIVGLDGTISDFDVDEIDIKSTLFCVLSAKAKILEHVDLIDTPGNSDPNIPPECWERMVQFADGLVWCTSAMQAWKQTEKATCSDLPEDLRERATLMITQADRMPDEKSAEKVLRRVTRDASKYFDEIMMGSMLNDDDIARISERIVAVSGTLELRGAESDVVDRVRPIVPVEVEAPANEGPAKAKDEPAGSAEAPQAVADETKKKAPQTKAVTRTVVGPWSLVEPAEAEEEALSEADAEDVRPDQEAKVSSDDDAKSDTDGTTKEKTKATAETAPEEEVQATEIATEIHEEADESGNSFGMRKGAVADLWTELTENKDLSDNERFLECVSSLLSEVQKILNKPTEVHE